jgi:hypothetical protein
MKQLASLAALVAGVTIALATARPDAPTPQFSDRIDLVFDPSDEAEAIQLIAKENGKVSRDAQVPGAPIVGVELIGARVSDATAVALGKLTCVRSLDLQSTDGKGGVVQHLGGLRLLEKLDLGLCPWLTDAGVAEVAHLSRLRCVNLQGCDQVTDAGLKALAHLPRLRELNLRNCPKLTGAGLKALAACDDLGELDLMGSTQLSDADLKEMAALKNLRSLDLRLCEGLSAQGVQALKEALPACKFYGP